jgi:hypothetical protein
MAERPFCRERTYTPGPLRSNTEHNDLNVPSSGSDAPAPALSVMTSQPDDIGRKFGRAGNDLRWRCDRRDRRFGRRRFNQGQNITALLRDLPPTGLSPHAVAGENVQFRRAPPAASSSEFCSATSQDGNIVLKVSKRCAPLRVSRQNFQNCYLKTRATPATATQYTGEANGSMNFGSSCCE